MPPMLSPASSRMTASACGPLAPAETNMIPAVSSRHGSTVIRRPIRSATGEMNIEPIASPTRLTARIMPTAEWLNPHSRVTLGAAKLAARMS